MSVAVIASYLAFFPVAVGMLRGLQSPDTIHVELMRRLRRGVVVDPRAAAAARLACPTCCPRCVWPPRTP